MKCGLKALLRLAENKQLREALGLPLENVVSEKSITEPADYIEKEENNEISITISSINKHSPPEEKIELFMSLFRGRPDVYAKRFYSKKHGSSYYIPACKNEWVRGLCSRANTKCKDCNNRDFLPLTTETINAHLRNKDENGTGVVGIYHLLPDETCLFLAIDFDEEKWQNDISAFRTVCKELNIPVAIERSRSGNVLNQYYRFQLILCALSFFCSLFSHVQ